MTIRMAAIEVGRWHAVFDSAVSLLVKPLTLTRFPRQL